MTSKNEGSSSGYAKLNGVQDKHNIMKETFNANSSGFPFREWHVRFPKLPFTDLSYQE